MSELQVQVTKSIEIVQVNTEGIKITHMHTCARKHGVYDKYLLHKQTIMTNFEQNNFAVKVYSLTLKFHKIMRQQI